MFQWLRGLSEAWSWEDPSLLLSLGSFAGTVLIPVFIWRLGSKQAERDSVLNEQQTRSLALQEAINRRGRRDSLISQVQETSNPEHIQLLWQEVLEFEENDREVLLAAFRANIHVALPGTSIGTRVSDSLSEQSVTQYVRGLELRFTKQPRRIRPFVGLIGFISHVRSYGFEIESYRIANLVTGPSAIHQRPGHIFYRDLVFAMPEIAAELLRSIENIDFRYSGGLRLNVLTGALLAIREIDTGVAITRGSIQYRSDTNFLMGVAMSLDYILQRRCLHSLDKWTVEGSTEPVTATIAWLVYAVGALADVNDHHSLRMIQNLAIPISKIPDSDKFYNWGRDCIDVRTGIERIKEKQPGLWEEYGSDIESAISEVGAW